MCHSDVTLMNMFLLPWFWIAFSIILLKRASAHHRMLSDGLSCEEHLTQYFCGCKIPYEAHLPRHAELASLRAPDLARHAHR